MQYIANLCPDIAGTAVFDARSLVRIFNDSAYFNDSTICSDGSGGIELAKMKLPLDTIKTSYLKVYPNPAKEQVTITYQLANSSGLFELYDVTGRLVTSFDITTSSGQMTLSVADIPSGIYIYKLVSDGDSDKLGKLAVIK